jgi:hypothetical protein
MPFASDVEALIRVASADRLALLERVRESHAEPAPYPPIVVGARVKYTRAHLKATLEPPGGRLWSLRSTVIAIGQRWLTIVRDDERESMLVHPKVVQRVEIPDACARSAAELGYAGVFGFEKQWTGADAEMLRVMAGAQ